MDKTEIKITFAENLRHYRIAKNYTQGKLGKLAGYDNKAISKYESGSVEPSLETLAKLAQVLDVSIDQLVTGNSYKRKAAEYDYSRFTKEPFIGSNAAMETIKFLRKILELDTHSILIETQYKIFHELSLYEKLIEKITLMQDKLNNRKIND